MDYHILVLKVYHLVMLLQIKKQEVATTSGTQEVMKASYAYGPVTVAYTNNDYDIASTANNNSDQETTSWAVSYTVTDAISVTYATEEISSGNTSHVDAEFCRN